jgi:hypothetical protein
VDDGSVTFWYGSGSADPYYHLWIRTLIYSSVGDKMPTKYFLKVHSYQLSKTKSKKEVNKYPVVEFFCLLMEGSGSRSGSIQNNDESGCGSRRSKNIRILQIRLRIHNTDWNRTKLCFYSHCLFAKKILRITSTYIFCHRIVLKYIEKISIFAKIAGAVWYFTNFLIFCLACKKFSQFYIFHLLKVRQNFKVKTNFRLPFRNMF